MNRTTLPLTTSFPFRRLVRGIEIAESCHTLARRSLIRTTLFQVLIERQECSTDDRIEFFG